MPGLNSTVLPGLISCSHPGAVIMGVSSALWGVSTTGLYTSKMVSFILRTINKTLCSTKN